MIKSKQRKLVKDILRDLRYNLVMKSADLPENWDGREIRRWVGDYYDMNYRNVGELTGSRKKDYDNEIITNNKLT